jgi:RNA polymerase-binding transcription factor DksA
MLDVAARKLALEKKLLELSERADEIEEGLREPGDDDFEEQAVESAADEVLEGVADVTREEIDQIGLALSRIEAGTYGICSSCGEKIPVARLEAIPHATKCLKCA